MANRNRIARIDIHKKLPAVGVGDPAGEGEMQFQPAKSGAWPANCAAWQRGPTPDRRIASSRISLATQLPRAACASVTRGWSGCFPTVPQGLEGECGFRH
jgi:hypothetical protein